MRIRDSFAKINDDKTEHVMPSGGIDIIADDGRSLFSISLNKDGTLRVSAGHCCKHQGVLLDDVMILKPIASNCVTVARPPYEILNPKKAN